VAVGIVAVGLGMIVSRPARARVLTGVVLRQEGDPRKQVPIASAAISATDGVSTVTALTDAAGLFRLNWRARVWPGETIALKLRHPEYQPLDIGEAGPDELYVFRMVPVAREPSASGGPPRIVANVRVRYAVTTTTSINAGSAVKTFEVINTGNVPCKGDHICSADGKWKAAIAGTSLDAGEGNEFAAARLSCIAGPCPFTRIEDDGFSTGGRRIHVTVRNWSDTASFLLEADVIHTMTTDMIRQSYPAEFGQGLDFTLPASAQGLSLQADIGGTDIVYPLGPTLKLSWATCSVKVADHTKVYHCDLKPGFVFKNR